MAGAGLDLVCTTTADWCRTLERLIGDEGARADAGRRGRQYADANFSEAQLLARWDALFATLL
jgi:hypothetical protein